MSRQLRFSKDDIVAAGLRIVRSGGFGAVSARALGKDARPEIAENIARECLGSVGQGYALTTEKAGVLFRQMWPVACGIAALCVRHPENFPNEEVSRTLSYHFYGIMSIIKSGEEVEDVKPLEMSKI